MQKQKKSKIATQKDVAERANVSQAAVSVVLNGLDNGNITVSPARRKSILEAAIELNYRTNLSARAMRQKKGFHIGYFVATADQTDFDFSAFRAGVYDAASELNYHVVLARLPNPIAMQLDSIPRIFRSHGLAGLVVNEINPLPADVRHALHNMSEPIVYLNNRYASNCVCVDDRLGASMAVHHLVDQGFRKIAYLEYHHGEILLPHESQKDRRSAYLEVMHARKLPEQCIDYGDADPSRLRDVLRSADRPDAFFCYDDYTALHAQRHFYWAGLEIGRDVGLVGYNQDSYTPLSAVPLSTVKIPRYEMAEAAMRMCISLIDGDRREIPPVIFNPTLVVRQSSLRTP